MTKSMPLTKSKKLEIVKTIREQYKKAKVTIFANFHGLNVAKVSMLRRALRKDFGDYLVAKKTLAQVALKDEGIELPALPGEMAFIFGSEDPIAVAKGVYDFSRKNEELKILGGIFEGMVVAAESIIQLAKIPPREVLLAQFLSVLQAPMRGLMMTLNGNQRKLVVALSEIAKKKGNFK